MEAEHPALCSRNVVRAILYVNFFLFGLFVIPITHHWIDHGFLALRSINLEDVVGQSLQMWLVGSTITATALFGFIGWKTRAIDMPAGSHKFEAILLLSWWIIVIGTCIYAFALGMGG
jgi:hypothetical protein